MVYSGNNRLRLKTQKSLWLLAELFKGGENGIYRKLTAYRFQCSVFRGGLRFEMRFEILIQGSMVLLVPSQCGFGKTAPMQFTQNGI
jgi:hypothetical protein